MAEVFAKSESSDKPKYLHVNKFWLLLVAVAVGALISSSIFTNRLRTNFTNRLRSNLTISSRSSIPSDEIAIPYFHKNINQPHSKFRCTGAENDVDAWRDRLCVFYNTCYERDARRFYYFQSTGRKPKPLFYDSAKGMLFQFSGNGRGDPFLSLATGGDVPWAPIAVNEAYPTKDFTRLHPLHSLMKTRFGADNIAHGLWEDLGSVSYSMERMNIVDPKLVIMHYGQILNTTIFRSYRQYVLPSLTENPLVEFETYIKSFNTKYVCFDSLIAGGQLNLFPKRLIKESHGREALFYNWRSKIIQYNGFDPKFVPKDHHIIITNKSQSGWTRSNAKRHRAIVNLEEVEKFIRQNYPTISTEVVEWHIVPFNKQIEKLLQTTILITPCGGVSLIIPFLPHGAHAIVMDYYVSVSMHDFAAGQSGSMEGALLNHIAHVRKQYYQIYGPQDYQFDYPGASNPREDSSIIVNMTRLQLLIDKALEEMEP